MSDQSVDDTEHTECTIMECSGEAEYAYWMPDLGQFSRVRSPEHEMLDDGDLAPYVCESCRDHMAGSSHWDGERFFRPEEKLVADGGLDHWQQCEMPECLNEVPKAKGICDECAGVGGGSA